MPLLRQTAKKVRVRDLMEGTWVKKEGMVSSFVTTPQGEDVARARVLATIVAKFISEDKNFGSLTLDDGSDTIRAKCFKELKPLEKAEIGQLVDLIGKVREYQGVIYLMPDIILKVQDPNWELLRKLELAKKYKGVKLPESPQGRSSGPVREQVTPKGPQEEKPRGGDNLELRRKVLKMIESGEEGVEFSEIMKKAGAPEPRVEAVLNELLSEGICYEPTPGKIRKI